MSVQKLNDLKSKISDVQFDLGEVRACVHVMSQLLKHCDNRGDGLYDEDVDVIRKNVKRLWKIANKLC